MEAHPAMHAAEVLPSPRSPSAGHFSCNMFDCRDRGGKGMRGTIGEEYLPCVLAVQPQTDRLRNKPHSI